MENQQTKLLVVDDNEDNRDIISRQLRRQGYDVLTAEDGEEALRVVAAQPVDLIVLDIMMPGIDGMEVLRRLRLEHSPAELPIIMATAKTDSQDIVQSAALGANDHVGKPLDVAVLLAKIEALLRLKAVAAQPQPTTEPSPGEVRPGATLAGKYQLQELIGVGNFGTVYKARHLEIELDVAVKILQPGFTAQDASLRRFRQEGLAACRIRHPNAVTVFDFGVTASRVAFLVMELLEGAPLTRELTKSGTFSPHRANEILQPICAVLDEAHAQDLVHRDIKPENIFLHRARQDEVVKVLDFGLAKLVGESAVQDNLTAEGWILGTPAYMAPERFSNRGYDGRADVYSLGVLLFELLTGRQPFRTNDRSLMQVLRQHVYEKPPTLRSLKPELPIELEEPIVWALAKDPRQRPDAATLAQTFAECVDRYCQEPVSGPKTEDQDLAERREAATIDAVLPAADPKSPWARLLPRWLKKP